MRTIRRTVRSSGKPGEAPPCGIRRLSFAFAPCGIRRLAFASIALLALASAAPLGAQQRVERRIAVAADVAIKIWLPAGSIRIVAWERDSLVVEGTVQAGGRFFFGGAGRAAKFGIDEPLPGEAAQAANLVAYVPRRARVSVRAVNASIEVAGVSGSYNTVAGDIRVSGQVEDLTVEAMDGTVHLDVTAPHVRARTASGALTVAGRIEDLAAATVSGAIDIRASVTARGRFESVTGPVTVSGRLDPAATIGIDTHSGSVDLRLVSPLGGALDLTSVTGRITNGLDKRMPLTSSKGRGHELSFDTGRAGPRITVRSFKGSIALRPR